MGLREDAVAAAEAAARVAQDASAKKEREERRRWEAYSRTRSGGAHRQFSSRLTAWASGMGLPEVPKVTITHDDSYSEEIRGYGQHMQYAGGWRVMGRFTVDQLNFEASVVTWPPEIARQWTEMTHPNHRWRWPRTGFEVALLSSTGQSRGSVATREDLGRILMQETER